MGALCFPSQFISKLFKVILTWFNTIYFSISLFGFIYDVQLINIPINIFLLINFLLTCSFIYLYQNSYAGKYNANYTLTIIVWNCFIVLFISINCLILILNLYTAFCLIIFNFLIIFTYFSLD